MPLLDRIHEDTIKALKGGDQHAATTLRGLKSDLKYYQIDKRLESVTDEDVVTVLSAAAKRRRDSIAQFTTGGRTDLVTKESRELDIILGYLPRPLSDNELAAIVQEAITETGAATPADLGKVMKAVIPKVLGRADGKVIKETVIRLLTDR